MKYKNSRLLIHKLAQLHTTLKNAPRNLNILLAEPKELLSNERAKHSQNYNNL